jgi:hypothetical protein
MPHNALANGLWLGDIPSELKDLLWMEQKLIAHVSTNYCVVQVHASKLYKMKTNVVCCAIPMKKIHDTLPPARAKFEEVLAILFIGPAAPTPTDYKCTPLLVWRSKVLSALNWLKLNHIDYANLNILHRNLDEYPENEPPVFVNYHKSYADGYSESTPVNGSEDDNFTSSGNLSFVVHSLTGDQLSDLWSKDDRKTIRMEAMKYFAKGGKALEIGKSDKLESLWDNPQLYPSMEVWTMKEFSSN